MDALCLNDVLEYNPPYVKSDFTCNLGPTKVFLGANHM